MTEAGSHDVRTRNAHQGRPTLDNDNGALAGEAGRRPLSVQVRPSTSHSSAVTGHGPGAEVVAMEPLAVRICDTGSEDIGSTFGVAGDVPIIPRYLIDAAIEVLSRCAR